MAVSDFVDWISDARNKAESYGDDLMASLCVEAKRSEDGTLRTEGEAVAHLRGRALTMSADPMTAHHAARATTIADAIEAKSWAPAPVETPRPGKDKGDGGKGKGKGKKDR